MSAWRLVAALLLGLAPFLGAATQGLAAPAEVLAVRALPLGDGTWEFDVTLRHPDEGWEHYADAWEVTAPDGSVLGTRVLLHPHIEEQPFTRSLSDVAIPAAVTEVIVRAHCKVDGFTGAEGFTVALPR